jgi:hypothetical protein
MLFSKKLLTKDKLSRLPMRSRRRFGHPEAEALAVQALAYLAADQSRLARFLALTGLDPGTIRAAAGSPGFLGAVLDYVASHEALLVDLAREIGVEPETMITAREILAPSNVGE